MQLLHELYVHLLQSGGGGGGGGSSCGGRGEKEKEEEDICNIKAIQRSKREGEMEEGKFSKVIN